jgi:nucleoside-diphosphate-sugar epimerase
MARILILGAGYTGGRVAALLRAAGHHVVTTRREGGDLPVVLPNTGVLRSLEGTDWRVLWSAPPVEGILVLTGIAERVVYLSTTGVYGEVRVVDASTAAAPATERTRLRLAAEEVVLAGPWSSCVLRPAAIYGPGRGAHESIRAGRWRVAGDGSNYTSRIHVDDLASMAAAAVLGELGGAWPVADEEPCANAEITRFCCDLMGMEMPASAPAGALDETRRADRRVDGSEARRRLGVSLRYPSYRIGVPAALAASF